MSEDFRYYQSHPVGPDAHHDVPLSNFAVSAFARGAEGFVGNDLFPANTVDKQSNRYYVIDKTAFLRNVDARRSPGTKSKKVEFRVSSEPYYAENYALHTTITAEDGANADAAIQLRQNGVDLINTNLLRAQEVRIANLCTTSGNLGGAIAVSSKWSASASGNSDPLTDVQSAHAFIQRTTGLIANTMVLDWDTFQAVRRHADLLDLYKYTSGGELDESQLAQAFKVQRLLVAHGVVENALEGGTTSMTNIWGNNAILAYVGANTGLQSQTLGLRFQWRNPAFPSNFGVMRRMAMGAAEEKVEYIESGHYQDERLVATNLGFQLLGTL